MSPYIFENNQIVDNKYTVERFLGEGAFAQVYRVHHPVFGKQAMKVFNATDLDEAKIKELFLEPAMLSTFNHRNIVRVFDAGITATNDGKRGYFTMEYCPMGTLHKYWSGFGAIFMPVEKSVNILVQICEGLVLAHSVEPPIIHRDLKPENILVGFDKDDLRIRISDFGLAKNVNPLTYAATAAGTLQFKPPECFLGYKADSTAADTWSLGVIIYLLLTDKFPYDMDQLIAIAAGREVTEFTPPNKVNVDVDPYLCEVVKKSLHVDKEQRFKNAMEMLAALQNWGKARVEYKQTHKKLPETPTSKGPLGSITPADPKKARGLLEKALELGKNPSQLSEAADLLEEAFSIDPSLRAEHEDLVRKWRREAEIKKPKPENPALESPYPEFDPEGAQELVRQALALRRNPRRLFEAASLMEVAFNKDPSLRAEYEDQVKNWQRGIMF